MQKAFAQQQPNCASTARVAENACLIGAVTLAEGSNIWYGSVLRGDVEPIFIGEDSNIQDLVMVHTDFGMPCRVGRRVTVGHSAILHSCIVEDDCLIGMGAILLSGCQIGAGSLIAAGALIPEGKIIPPGSVVMGCPGKIVRQTTAEDLAVFRHSAQHYCENAAQQLPLAAES